VLQGGLLVVRVDVLVLVVGEVSRRDLGEPPEDAAAEASDVVVGRRLQRYGREGAGRVGYEQAAGCDAVKVNVKIEGAAKFLDKCDRSCLATVDAGGAAAMALPGKDALEIAAEHGRQEVGVAREVDAELVRQKPTRGPKSSAPTRR